MEDVLKEIKETDALCTVTKMQCEAGQTHFLKHADNPIDQSGIISGVRSAQSYFQSCLYQHQLPSHVLQMSSLNPQMVPGTLKANMWQQLLAGFPLMAQDGPEKVFNTCSPCAPSLMHRGVQWVCRYSPWPRCWHWGLGAILRRACHWFFPMQWPGLFLLSCL